MTKRRKLEEAKRGDSGRDGERLGCLCRQQGWTTIPVPDRRHAGPLSLALALSLERDQSQHLVYRSTMRVKEK